MAEMTREEAIGALNRLKTTHMGDFGWDTTGVKALDFAISDMKRVEKLEEMFENLNAELASKKIIIDGLIEGIEKVKAEIENLAGQSCIVSDGIVNDALDIIDKYLGE